MISKQEVERTDFVKSVVAFKKRYQKKLKEMINNKESAVTKSFLADPVIHSYLTRENVVFKNRHPDLSDSQDKEAHIRSDHYELKIYAYLPNVIAYRNEFITYLTFYDAGTPQTVLPLLQKLLQAANKTSAAIAFETLDVLSQDIALQDILQEPNGPNFRVDCSELTEHSTTLLSIFHPVSKNLLAVLLFNSQGVTAYNVRLEHFFKSMQILPNHYLNRGLLKSVLMNLFSFNIDEQLPPNKPELILLNRKKSSACVIYSSYYASVKSKELQRIENSTEIKTIFHISSDRKCYNSIHLGIPTNPFVTIVHRLDVPFIDVSHELQKDNNDCTLYCFNFIKAILSMLENPDMAQHILKLSTDLMQIQSKVELTNIFRNHLKVFLSQYYDQTGKSKSENDLENYHLRQRWELGKMSLGLFYNPKNEDIDKAQIVSPFTNIFHTHSG